MFGYIKNEFPYAFKIGQKCQNAVITVNPHHIGWGFKCERHRVQYKVEFSIDDVDFKETSNRKDENISIHKFTVIEKIETSNFDGEIEKRQEEKWYQDDDIKDLLYEIHKRKYQKKIGKDNDLINRANPMVITLRSKIKGYNDNAYYIGDFNYGTLGIILSGDNKVYDIKDNPQCVISKDDDSGLYTIYRGKGKKLINQKFEIIDTDTLFNNHVKVVSIDDTINYLNLKTGELVIKEVIPSNSYINDEDNKYIVFLTYGNRNKPYCRVYDKDVKKYVTEPVFTSHMYSLGSDMFCVKNKSGYLQLVDLNGNQLSKVNDIYAITRFKNNKCLIFKSLNEPPVLYDLSTNKTTKSYSYEEFSELSKNTITC